MTDLGFVSARRLVDGSTDVIFSLAPGDRPLVEAGQSVVAGEPIADRLRDARLSDVSDTAALHPKPGGRVDPGELLFEWRGRWRVAGGEMSEPLETPVAGIVRSVRPGTSIVVRATGRALPGIVTLGGPTRGRLHVAASSDGELRAGGLDVGLAGTILVVGSRIDAETLTRARAMGIRGIVVAGLASKERRDFLASEKRQKAALHRLPPYAVLVLDGAVRRPLSSPVMGVLRALAGHDVAIVNDPPGLLFDAPDVDLPVPAADLVRIRGGDLAGREGQWAGLVGQRRFAGGVHLEAGSVRLADGSVVALPIGDLERFV
ncbi:MAG TPA: hypothetical protein VD763_12545 [Candidatus Saccharimonadales bacterium]|nr:hypothetical protein [Candidatus Saccharimonadales bacterium]